MDEHCQSRLRIFSLAYSGSHYAASGYASSGAYGQLVSSPDGINWTTASTASNFYMKVKAVNNEFFAMGYADVTFTGVILHSTDGITWNDITPNLPFQVYHFNDVVFDGTKYHFMGVESNDPATFDVDDFFSISTANLADPNSFGNKGTISAAPEANIGGNGEGVFAYSNGKFVGSAYDAYTQNSYILYSNDGVSWTAAVSEEPFYMTGIAATGSRFLMTEFNGVTASVASQTARYPCISHHLLQNWWARRWCLTGKLDRRKTAIVLSYNTVPTHKTGLTWEL